MERDLPATTKADEITAKIEAAQKTLADIGGGRVEQTQGRAIATLLRIADTEANSAQTSKICKSKRRGIFLARRRLHDTLTKVIERSRW